MRKLLFLFLLMALQGHCMPPVVSSAREALLHYQQHNQIPAVMAVVYYKGMPYFIPLGSATDLTPFGIGSITKSFTAIVLGNAIIEGRLSLDQPVALYLTPEFSHVTFRHLATHTSGLPRVMKNMRNMNKQQVILNLKNFKPVPGKKHLYSNMAFGLLGMALENALHEDYASLLSHSILQPLHMDQTRLKEPNSTRAASGGLISTGQDMAKFLAACLNLPGTPDKLSRAIRITETGTFSLSANRVQALSWVKHTMHGHSVYVKNGGVPGFSSFMGYVPDLQTGIVILANREISSTPVGLSILEKFSLEKHPAD